MDIGSPVTSGIALAASLKEHPVYKNIPILAASDYSVELNRKLCLADGCDDFISKPLAFAELEMRLNNLMSMEKRKIIRASEPENLGSPGWQQSLIGAGRRRVA